MRRSLVYPVAAGVGLLVGAGVGIAGRDCGDPTQGSLLGCVTEDPIDTLSPALTFALVAIAVVATYDLVRSAIRDRAWITLGLMGLGVGTVIWLVEGPGMWCRGSESEMDSVYICMSFDWPTALINLPLLTTALGLVGVLLTHVVRRVLPS